MGATFKATAKMLVRSPSVLIWALAFPIIMSTIFMFMFSDMRPAESVEAVPVATVEDEAWDASPFSFVVEGLSAGDGAIVDVRPVDDAVEARELLQAGEVDGVFRIDADGGVALDVAPETSSAHMGDTGESYGVNRSILEAVASSYVQSEELLRLVAEDDPAALADPGAVARALSLAAESERISLTHAEPDDTVRYYYALLGMATMFAAQVSMLAVASIRPTSGAVAARRCVAGVSRVRQLAGALAASVAITFAFLCAAFAYMRLVVGIDFAGREALCVVGVAAGSFMACGIGALVGSLPLKGGVGAGSGILTALSCVLSIFAGLYGEAVMELADSVAQAFPLTAWLNPVKLVCDLFSSLYFYESLAPFWMRAAACVAWGVALFALSAPMFRRVRYEHL